MRLRAYTDVAGVNIFDSNGQLINSSEHWPVPSVNISDRKFFKAFKSGSPFERFRIELVQGRFQGGWATVVACKVSGPNGEFQIRPTPTDARIAPESGAGCRVSPVTFQVVGPL